MKEQFLSEQPQPSMEKYRKKFFESLQKDTRIYSDDKYQKLYILAKLYWGIDSPAFIMPKYYFDKHPHPELIPNDLKERLIAINSASVPDPDFIKYLTEHEYWEIYIDEKRGFNLEKHSKTDFQLPTLEKKRPAHRYSTLKEFQAAEKDGKLDEYMQWWKEFYQANIEKIQSLSEEDIKRISKNYGENGGDKNMIIKMIKKNLKIKEDIYNKILAKRQK